ncbi:MAG: lysophospholipid acyltransferase family protein [Paludibacter sp.]|nr:lysophospholipid acyltransferase family protein [Paludibacter sp.]MBP7613088.1 lysophospholipid acyltransferase family protein [Paludibacter sp.]
MIKAKHHKIILPLFKWLSRFMINRKFSSIHIDGKFDDNGHSVLVVANHISWWDGFWIEYLNHKTMFRTFHFMMLEEQLKKHWYFQHTGGYSVKKKSREMLESINYTVELLEKEKNMVLMFPQGKIHSSHNSSIRFESGIQQIIKKCKNETQVLFVANLTDYFSDAKPHLFIYTKICIAGSLKNSNIEEEYNLFLTEVLNQHKTKTS